MERRNLKRVNYKETRSYNRRVPPVAGCTASAKADMASEKVYGQLNGMIFQMNELMEDLGDLGSLSMDKLNESHDELKALRVDIYSLNSELLALQRDAYSEDTSKTVSAKLVESKKMLKDIEGVIASSAKKGNDQEKKQKEIEVGGRKFAYEKVLKEVIDLINLLVDKYNIADDRDALTKEIVLKRKEMKNTYASDYERSKVLIDRLLSYTDVAIDGKELVINAQILKLSGLSLSKISFEEKLVQDLEKFDLTDQKLKLATQTKINIGKFSGSLDKGMDFYTFRSKFLRAYANYPKELLVEWLTNNHLEGKAKECIGSLNNLDEIWNRLRSNFGNTELLLEHQFTKIYKLGPMRNQKSYEMKRHFLQSLLNSAQDVNDIASDHSLQGMLQYGNHLQKIVMGMVW